MAALVLKSWKVQNEPFEQGNTYIVITARPAGLLSWFLQVVGIDATTTIRVTSEKVEFTSSSLAGSDHRVIPLQNVCSTYYGYHKPWIGPAMLFGMIAFYDIWFHGRRFNFFFEYFRFEALILPLSILLGGLAIAFVLYFLNRTLTLGFVENSGVINGIRFKRSVIENQDINQERAHTACDLIQALIEMKQKQLLVSS